MILTVENPDVPRRAVSDALARTLAFFSEDTPLKRAEPFGGRPYERREQQERMAAAVAEALEKRRNLCVEAPTGVGKSFAYLVPAIYHALATRQPVLVATETINLQEQLAEKDLPLLRDLTRLPFTFVVAKGRTNYLCKRRLALAMGRRRDEILPPGASATDLDRICDWALTTKDGSKSDISFRFDQSLWACLCCETASCMGPKCEFFHSCFYWRQRHAWDKADLIVANHALFFTDLKMRSAEDAANCPLPDYGSVIFDEAHTLEDNAANHLGIHVHSAALRFFLNRLFNPINGRGILMRSGEDSMALRGQVADLHEELTDFFAQFEEAIDRSPEQMFRVMKPGGYRNGLSEKLRFMAQVIRDYAETQTDASFKAELNARVEHCQEFDEEIDAFVRQSLPEHVYWVEGRKSPGGWNAPRRIELASAPLNIAELLNKLLFSIGKPVILTSATLAVKGSLGYYAQRVGFTGGDGLILDSPFDYSKQVRLYLSRKMPLPSEQGYNDAAAAQIRRFLEMTRGSAFVLFTSYGMLKSCADKLSSFFSTSGLNLLVHGDSLSRSAMLREFKQVRDSVIFGTTSFWTGVDVPGSALENVIIAKLPFSVPTHPLVAARCDRIRQLGGEPFRDYSVPDAVLKFRQGVGRLIRSRTDTGIIVVLDPRIVSKQYGKAFLNSIPPCPVEYF